MPLVRATRARSSVLASLGESSHDENFVPVGFEEQHAEQHDVDMAFEIFQGLADVVAKSKFLLEFPKEDFGGCPAHLEPLHHLWTRPGGIAADQDLEPFLPEICSRLVNGTFPRVHDSNGAQTGNRPFLMVHLIDAVVIRTRLSRRIAAVADSLLATSEWKRSSCITRLTVDLSLRSSNTNDPNSVRVRFLVLRHIAATRAGRARTTRGGACFWTGSRRRYWTRAAGTFRIIWGRLHSACRDAILGILNEARMKSSMAPLFLPPLFS